MMVALCRDNVIGCDLCKVQIHMMVALCQDNVIGCDLCMVQVHDGCSVSSQCHWM